MLFIDRRVGGVGGTTVKRERTKFKTKNYLRHGFPNAKCGTLEDR